MEIVLENKGDSIFRCTYIPVLQGAHTIYVTFAGQQIPRSPFTVHISEGWFGSFQVFVLSHLKVSLNLVVQYEGQNRSSTPGPGLTGPLCCLRSPSSFSTSLGSLGSSCSSSPPQFPVVPEVQGLKCQVVRLQKTLMMFFWDLSVEVELHQVLDAGRIWNQSLACGWI